VADEKKQPLSVKVKNAAGADSGQVQLDEAVLGGMVKNRLMHAASVVYHANTRAGTHSTKTRAEVAGSTKKLYRQKGTGRARAGSRKATQRRHGGIVHGPRPKSYYVQMPKKMRRAAVNSAVLGKIKDAELDIVETLVSDGKTKSTVETLKKMGLVKKGERTSLLLVTESVDHKLVLATRNFPGVSVLPALDVNAQHMLTHKKVVFTRAAFRKFQALAETRKERKPRKLKGTRKAEAAPAVQASK
jgi:large subunit ribosomal protein L4